MPEVQKTLSSFTEYVNNSHKFVTFILRQRGQELTYELKIRWLLMVLLLISI